MQLQFLVLALSSLAQETSSVDPTATEVAVPSATPTQLMGKCYKSNRTTPTPTPTPPPRPPPKQPPPRRPVEPERDPEIDSQDDDLLPPLANDCLETLNRARYFENRGPPLEWDSYLASRARNSALYCANVAQEHTDVIGGQILFITKTSCSSGIKGWFYDEKPYNGGHYRIIKNKKYRKVGCAVIGSGSRCISCNFK